MWAALGGLSQTSGKLWQDYSNCYMQCSKLLPVRQPEADNFGGGLGTLFKLYINFMFMVWDSRQQDWQLFLLSFEHCYMFWT